MTYQWTPFTKTAVPEFGRVYSNGYIPQVDMREQPSVHLRLVQDWCRSPEVKMFAYSSPIGNEAAGPLLLELTTAPLNAHVQEVLTSIWVSW